MRTSLCIAAALLLAAVLALTGLGGTARAWAAEPDWAVDVREGDAAALAGLSMQVRLRSGDRLLQPENLARIRTPALVIRAELDDLVRPDGQDAFVRGVPCARLVTIRGVKHEIYRSKNDQLLPYLETIFRFLEEE